MADRQFPVAESSALIMARLDIAHRRALHRGDLLQVSRCADQLPASTA